MDQPRRSSWWKRSVAFALTNVCPTCKTAGPVRLQIGQLCAACEAQTAWSKLDDGARLVIDRRSIDDAVKRREGEAAGEPAWRRAVVWAAPAVTVGIAALAGWYTLQVFATRRLAPLRELVAAITSTARGATYAGLAALVAGTIALIRLRRNRHFRRLPLVASHSLAIAVGCTALVIGVPQLIVPISGFGEYTSMPVRGSLDVTANAERIVNATVVVLATDADGDAAHLGIGTGAVIAADDSRAWIVTCSHVAMPYLAVAAWRHARDARPVWVQLSDGREGQATVRWTAPPPLDVALVELPIAHPPEPVAIAPDTTAIQAPASVTFVPNPYRSGWKVLSGTLLRRETHRTPAGTYDLLYTDLPVTFGDSGSGLFDARGQLVGLNTWTRVTGDGPSQGISLPSETMRVLVDAIRAGTIDKLDEAIPAEALAVPAAAPAVGKH